MATAKIVECWQDGSVACIVARVDGDSMSAVSDKLTGPKVSMPVAVEYRAQVSLRDDSGQLKTTARLQADLQVALQVERARSKALEMKPVKVPVPAPVSIEL